MGQLGLRNTARRGGRSLAVVAMLACGTFLVVAVGANRVGGPQDPQSRQSGTGGFAFIARTQTPVMPAAFAPRGITASGTVALPSDQLEGVGHTPKPQAGLRVPPIDLDVVPMRVKPGDDASCLNLGRPATPMLMGVDQNLLQSRGAFTFSKVIPGADPAGGWMLLDRKLPDGAVPAVADENTAEWSLHAGVGDTLTMADDRGGTFAVRIVGTLAGSILQGGLIISEREFSGRFPDIGGYRLFLVDAPAGRQSQVESELESRLPLRDAGLEITPAAQRLAQYNAVENTYIGLFGVLGGLGIVLGTTALGLVVLRNVLERRGELAVMRAMGFTAWQLTSMLLWEHATLLAAGVVAGAGAAAVSVIPAIRSPGVFVPYTLLAITLAAIVASGLLWTYAATAWALRGPVAPALRNE